MKIGDVFIRDGIYYSLIEKLSENVFKVRYQVNGRTKEAVLTNLKLGEHG